MGQAHQVTIVLKLIAKKYKNITHERVILKCLIKRLVTPQIEEDDIKPEGRKRRDDRSHQIYQFKWRI